MVLEGFALERHHTPVVPAHGAECAGQKQMTPRSRFLRTTRAWRTVQVRHSGKVGHIFSTPDRASGLSGAEELDLLDVMQIDLSRGEEEPPEALVAHFGARSPTFTMFAKANANGQ